MFESFVILANSAELIELKVFPIQQMVEVYQGETLILFDSISAVIKRLKE